MFIRSLPLCTSQQTTPTLSTKDYRVLLSSYTLIFAPSPNAGFVGVQEATKAMPRANLFTPLLATSPSNMFLHLKRPLLPPKVVPCVPCLWTMCTTEMIAEKKNSRMTWAKRVGKVNSDFRSRYVVCKESLCKAHAWRNDLDLRSISVSVL